MDFGKDVPKICLNVLNDTIQINWVLLKVLYEKLLNFTKCQRKCLKATTQTVCCAVADDAGTSHEVTLNKRPL